MQGNALRHLLRHLRINRLFKQFSRIIKISQITHSILDTQKKGGQQIKDKNYVASIKNYTGEILFVGINYNKKNKVHECLIEKFIK